MYPLLRPFLFQLEPETAHSAAMRLLGVSNSLGISRLLYPKVDAPCSVMGLNFSNPVGLAAGFDKNAEYLSAMAELGFGFIEVGTVTPLPQDGNPRPRLFRLPEHRALINRMGFNNKGLDGLRVNIQRAAYKGVLGINIGKNAATPIEEAVQDYLKCIDGVYDLASYIAVNISSPNTKGLRQLQESNQLADLLTTLLKRREELTYKLGRRVPLVVKVAPDLEPAEIEEIADVVMSVRMDGLIATNTTLKRDAVVGHKYAEEAGGLSGAPLSARAKEVVGGFLRRIGERVPVIASGGIMNAEDAKFMFDRGAKLVQLYTGFVYRGPRLIAECSAASKKM